MKTNTPKAVQACHDLLLWLVPLLDNFPRSRRFTLGSRLEEYLLDILGDLVKASWTVQKKQYLDNANIKLEMLRHLWRLCFELKLINIKRYEHGIRLMLDLGKQIGGWVRYTQ